LAQSAGGISIPNGVNPNAWTSGDITFLSGTPGAPPSFIDLTEEEISLFDADLRKLSYMVSLERDLSALLLSQRDAFLFAASIAKSQLTGRAFGGLLKGSGFNMQMIRPVTILSNVGAADGGGGGGTSVLNWKRTFNSTGWQALFGSNANSDPVSLGVTGTSTTAKTTYNRVVIAVPYLISTGASPKFVEVKFFVQQTNYPVYPLHWLKMSDLYVARFPGILLGLLNQQFSIEANIGTTGDDEPQLFGLQFVTNDYAVLET
jgi:hypothetical protein